jgi:hypothetical protein
MLASNLPPIPNFNCSLNSNPGVTPRAREGGGWIYRTRGEAAWGRYCKPVLSKNLRKKFYKKFTQKLGKTEAKNGGAEGAGGGGFR